MFANRCIDGEGGGHVHRVAHGNPGDGMRAMHAPSEAVLFSGGEEFVFLGVVEIFDVQTTLLFAKRCLRKASFTIRFERAEVVFETSNQCYMLNTLGRANGGEYVVYHGGIDANILGLRGLP